MHRVVCPFTPQLLLILINRPRKDGTLSWPRDRMSGILPHGHQCMCHKCGSYRYAKPLVSFARSHHVVCFDSIDSTALLSRWFTILSAVSGSTACWQRGEASERLAIWPRFDRGSRTNDMCYVDCRSASVLLSHHSGQFTPGGYLSTLWCTLR